MVFYANVTKLKIRCKAMAFNRLTLNIAIKNLRDIPEVLCFFKAFFIA